MTTLLEIYTAAQENGEMWDVPFTKDYVKEYAEEVFSISLTDDEVSQIVTASKTHLTLSNTNDVYHQIEVPLSVAASEGAEQ